MERSLFSAADTHDVLFTLPLGFPLNETQGDLSSVQSRTHRDRSGQLRVDLRPAFLGGGQCSCKEAPPDQSTDFARPATQIETATRNEDNRRSQNANRSSPQRDSQRETFIPVPVSAPPQPAPPLRKASTDLGSNPVSPSPTARSQGAPSPEVPASKPRAFLHRTISTLSSIPGSPPLETGSPWMSDEEEKCENDDDGYEIVERPEVPQQIHQAADPAMRLRVMDKINKMREMFLENESIYNHTLTYVPLLGRKAMHSSHYFDIHDHTIDVLERSTTPVLVIFGEAGSGKSAFGLNLVRYLWKTWDEQYPIPVLIPLTGVAEPYKDLIQERLSTPLFHGASHTLESTLYVEPLSFTPEEIVYLKANFRFVFVMDDYERLETYKNLYIENQLDSWHAKSIILCDSSLPKANPHYKELFCFSQSLGLNQFLSSSPQSLEPNFTSLAQRQATFQETYIAPLTPVQVELYIDKYIDTHQGDTRWACSANYLEYINRFVDLQSYSSNPFYLKMILATLPKVVDNARDLGAPPLKSIQPFDILGAYTMEVFEQHIQKIASDPTLSQSKTSSVISLDDAMSFHIAFAYQLMSQKTFVAFYKSKNRNIYDTENAWERFLTFAKNKPRVLRRTIFLEAQSRHHFGFTNKTFMNYFASLLEVKRLTGEALSLQIQSYFKGTGLLKEHQSSLGGSTIPVCLLSENDMSTNVEFLKIMAYHVQNNPNLEHALWTLVKNTVHDQSFNTVLLASHSLTILNYAGKPFKNMNLSQIHINGADLSHSIIDGTDLSNARLENSIFENVWLKNCNLAGASLAGSTFGFPSIFCHMDSIIHVQILTNRKAIVVIGGTKITIWDAMTASLIKSIEVPNGDRSSCICHKAVSSEKDIILIGTTNGALLSLKTEQDFLLQEMAKDASPLSFVFILSDHMQPPSKIVLVTFDSLVQIYDWESAQICREQKFDNDRASLYHLIQSPNDSSQSVFVFCDCSNLVNVYDLASFSKQKILQTSSRITFLSSFLMGDGGTSLCAGCEDGSIILWDTKTWNTQRRFTNKHNPIKFVSRVQSSKYGDLLLAYHENDVACIYDLGQSDQIMEYQLYDSCPTYVQALEFNGELCLVTAARDGSAKIRTINTLQDDGLNKGHDGKVLGVASFTYDEQQYFVTSGDDCTIRLWQGCDGKQIRKLVGHSQGPKYLDVIQIPQKNPLILSSSEDESTRLWTITDMDEIWINRKCGYARCGTLISISTDIYGIAMGLDKGKVVIINLESGIEINRFTCGNRPASVTTVRTCDPINGKDKILVAGCSDGFIYAWNIDTQGIIFSHQGNHSPILELYMPPMDSSSDFGGIFTSVGGDGVAHTWNLKDRTLLKTVRLSEPFIKGMLLYKQVKGLDVLVTLQNDGSIKFWDLGTGRLISKCALPLHQAQHIQLLGDNSALLVMDDLGRMICFDVETTTESVDCTLNMKWTTMKQTLFDSNLMDGSSGIQGLDLQFINVLRKSSSEIDSFKMVCDLHRLEIEALRGGLSSQHDLGLMFEEGIHTDRDPEKAFLWYNLAASKGHCPSQLRVAFCYETGFGVDQSYSDAIYWYKQAALKNNPVAQCRLGKAYMKGLGVAVDEAAALSYYISAARSGDITAQLTLGEYYSDERSPSASIKESIRWYQKASDFGNLDALVALAELYFAMGDRHTGFFEKAAEYFHSAAKGGHVVAQYRYSMCLLSGVGVAIDSASAVKWLHLAAETGHTDAQVNLGACYENGTGVDCDDSQAVYWYRQAAKQGDNDARVNLANCLRDGRGVEMDAREAVCLYHEAAENGDAEAMFNLGQCLENAVGAEKSYEQARVWYERAAEQNHALGCAALARFYRLGLGVDVDLDKAGQLEAVAGTAEMPNSSPAL